MKFASLDLFGISPIRLALVGAGASVSVSACVGVFLGGVLGGATPVTLALASLVVFYIVFSTPRRILDSRRMSQARDAVLIGAESRASMGVIGSRCRTLMFLHPRDRTLAAAVKEASRLVLLGHGIEEAIATSSHGVVSYSAQATLKGIATLRPDSRNSDDEETVGLASSADLSRETRLPLFMTVCFFAPIMMTMYAVFARIYDLQSLLELVALEFVAIDLAFYLVSQDRIVA